MAGKKKVKSGRLTVVDADCAGVDVGKSHHLCGGGPRAVRESGTHVRFVHQRSGRLGAMALGMRGQAGGDARRGIRLGATTSQWRPASAISRYTPYPHGPAS